MRDYLGEYVAEQGSSKKLTRKEQKQHNKKKVEQFGKNMKVALHKLSSSKEGLLLLRYLLHESCFLAPLTYETAEGVNIDVMLNNEAQRRMYLGLRVHMNRETILRVEFPDDAKPKGEPK